MIGVAEVFKLFAKIVLMLASRRIKLVLLSLA